MRCKGKENYRIIRHLRIISGFGPSASLRVKFRIVDFGMRIAYFGSLMSEVGGQFEKSEKTKFPNKWRFRFYLCDKETWRGGDKELNDDFGFRNADFGMLISDCGYRKSEVGLKSQKKGIIKFLIQCRLVNKIVFDSPDKVVGTSCSDWQSSWAVVGEPVCPDSSQAGDSRTKSKDIYSFFSN